MQTPSANEATHASRNPRGSGIWGILTAVLGLSLLLAVPFPTSGAESPGEGLWSAHVEPLLKERCSECHNPSRTKGGLDLSSLQSMLRGGERGAAVLPGRPEDSLLYKVLLTDADPHMPPGKRAALNAEEAEWIKTWIAKIPTVKPSEASGSNTPPESGAVKPAKATTLGWTPPPTMDPSRAVDGFLQRAWKRDQIRPAARTDEEAFARRVYLDLIGRIPTASELTEFQTSRAKNRRTQLIDSLINHTEHPRHLREIFDGVLMGRQGGKLEKARKQNLWFEFLERGFRENRPWNEFLRDCLTGRPQRPEDKGAFWYLYERTNQAQAIAEAVAPVVFGVQVKCAQCHDHMIAREIKQAHYWGMAAAFMRSKNVSTPDGPAVAESAIGGFVSFANLKKESQPALLTFFNGRRVEEARPGDGEKEVDAAEKYLVPPPVDKAKAIKPALPKFSRREAFAEAATVDNPLLARATVNRFWALLFGRGLVHPVDLMDSKHPPSHPELLDWLAKDFADHGYDVRRLIKTLCNTQAYQLDSRPPPPPASRSKSAKSGPTTPPDSFSYGLTKPLTAEQLFRSLKQATGLKPDDSGGLAGHSEADLRKAFIRQFPDLFPAEVQAGVQQAMFLANSPLFDSLTGPHPGSLSRKLSGIADPAGRVREAFQAVYHRSPDAAELAECVSYLAGRSTESGIRQLLWALLTSAEFQLNH